MKISDLQVNDKEFFIEIDDKYKAHILYNIENEHYTLLHCEVDHQLQGLGMGQEVIKKTFKHLKKSSDQVTIRCSYIKAMVKKLNL